MCSVGSLLFVVRVEANVVAAASRGGAESVRPTLCCSSLRKGLDSHDDHARRRQIDSHPSSQRRQEEDLDLWIVREVVDERLPLVDPRRAGEDDPFDFEVIEDLLEDVEDLGEL